MKVLATIFLMLPFGSAAFAHGNEAQIIWDYVHSTTQTLVNVPDRCLALFGPDEGTSDYTLREVHDAFCGGDPEILPALAFFRIATAGGKSSLLKYDVAADKYTEVFSEATPQ